MRDERLLAHVVTRFAPRQWENVASESLRYLLRFDGGREGVNSLLAGVGVSLDEDVRWRAQATSADDDSIPDLVADDRFGRHVLVIEAKFWAELTGNQPTTYLARQQAQFTGADDPHLLLFLAPQARVELLTGQLVDILEVPSREQGPLRVIATSAGLVAVTSWSQMLAHLRAEFDARSNLGALADLDQLASLCHRADQDAMMPLSAEDVDPVRGGRYAQFIDIVSDVMARLTATHEVNRDGLRQRARPQAWGLFARAKGHVFSLNVSSWSWSKRAATPWWLYLKPASTDVADALRALHGSPAHPWVELVDGTMVIGLRAPLGVERPVIVDQLTSAVLEVIALLPEVAVTDAAASSDGADDVEEQEEPGP